LWSWAEGEDVSTKDKLEEFAAAMRARWQASIPALSTTAKIGSLEAEREHEVPLADQLHSPLAGLDLDTAIRLRWALRDIKAKRTKLTPVNPSDLRILIEMGLVELRDNAPTLSNEGHQALDQ
jgi:hypothetical protein